MGNCALHISFKPRESIGIQTDFSKNINHNSTNGVKFVDISTISSSPPPSHSHSISPQCSGDSSTSIINNNNSHPNFSSLNFDNSAYSGGVGGGGGGYHANNHFYSHPIDYCLLNDKMSIPHQPPSPPTPPPPPPPPSQTTKTTTTSSSTTKSQQSNKNNNNNNTNNHPSIVNMIPTPGLWSGPASYFTTPYHHHHLHHHHRHNHNHNHNHPLSDNESSLGGVTNDNIISEMNFNNCQLTSSGDEECLYSSPINSSCSKTSLPSNRRHYRFISGGNRLSSRGLSRNLIRSYNGQHMTTTTTNNHQYFIPQTSSSIQQALVPCPSSSSQPPPPPPTSSIAKTTTTTVPISSSSSLQRQPHKSYNLLRRAIYQQRLSNKKLDKTNNKLHNTTARTTDINNNTTTATTTTSSRRGIGGVAVGGGGGGVGVSGCGTISSSKDINLSSSSSSSSYGNNKIKQWQSTNGIMNSAHEVRYTFYINDDSATRRPLEDKRLHSIANGCGCRLISCENGNNNNNGGDVPLFYRGSTVIPVTIIANDYPSLLRCLNTIHNRYPRLNVKVFLPT